MFLGIYIPFIVVFLRSCLVAPATQFSENCANVFESQEGYALFGHTFDTFHVSDYSQCAMKCMVNDTCQSYNIQTINSDSHQCELNDESGISKPVDFKQKQGYTYYGAVPVSCVANTCIEEKDCQCHPGYKGPRCLMGKLGHFPANPGLSCKHILDSNDSKGDGEYWIDPEKSGNPLKVFCDMTTDGGGWLLVANFVMDSPTPPSDWTAESSYRGIGKYHRNRMGITTSAMNVLRSHLSFTQLRFHCSKQQGRTFHVITAANNTGEAVVQYFSGQTNTLPDSCNSYVRMKDDNSLLAEQCSRWGNDGHSRYVGKWGHMNKQGEKRLYDHTAFVSLHHHWVITGGIWLCDDQTSNSFIPLSEGDFWKVLLR